MTRTPSKMRYPIQKWKVPTNGTPQDPVNGFNLVQVHRARYDTMVFKGPNRHVTQASEGC